MWILAFSSGLYCFVVHRFSALPWSFFVNCLTCNGIFIMVYYCSESLLVSSGFYCFIAHRCFPALPCPALRLLLNCSLPHCGSPLATASASSYVWKLRQLWSYLLQNSSGLSSESFWAVSTFKLHFLHTVAGSYYIPDVFFESMIAFDQWHYKNTLF